MRKGLYFLRSELPEGFAGDGFRWSLVAVKVGGAQRQGADPYLAFGTKDGAELAAQKRPRVSVVPAEEIDSTHFADFAKRAVVLFESKAHVQQYLDDRASFQYEDHLFTYSPANGLTRTVV